MAFYCHHMMWTYWHTFKQHQIIFQPHMKRSNEIVQPCAQQRNAMLPHYMTIYSPPCDLKKLKCNRHLWKFCCMCKFKRKKSELMVGVIAYAQSYVHIHVWKRKGGLCRCDVSFPIWNKIIISVKYDFFT
jgi:hypothetical protein